jgi:hypothetical protein
MPALSDVLESSPPETLLQQPTDGTFEANAVQGFEQSDEGSTCSTYSRKLLCLPGPGTAKPRTPE